MLIVGYHIAKTGGTTVMHHIKTHLGDDAYYGYGTHPEVRRFFDGKPLWSDMTQAERDQIRFSFGHGMNDRFLAAVAGRRTALFAVFRDPYTHFVSQFKHHLEFVKRQGRDLSAREYLESRGPNPVSTHMFENFWRLTDAKGRKDVSEARIMQVLRQFEFLCTTERLTEQSAPLCAALGIPPVAGRSRVTTHEADLEGITPEEVHALSPLDQRIHQILVNRDADAPATDELAFDAAAFEASINRIAQENGPEERIRADYERLTRYLTADDRIDAAHLYLGLTGQEDEKFDPVWRGRMREGRLLDPRALARAERAKGLVYTRFGKAKLARYCYEKAIGLHPKYAEAYSEFAQLMLRQKERDMAQGLAEKALEWNPFDKRAKKILETLAG